MSSVAVVRFPDGTKEFRFTKVVLTVGDTLWHDGERYLVVDVAADGHVTAVPDMDDFDEEEMFVEDELVDY